MAEPSGEQRPAVERLAEAAQAALGPGVPLRQPPPAPSAPPPPPVEAPVAAPAAEEKPTSKANSRLKGKGLLLLVAGLGLSLIVLLALWYHWPSSWRTVTAEPVLAAASVLTQAQVNKTVSDAVQPLRAEINRIAQEFKNLQSESEGEKSRTNDLATRLTVAEKFASELAARVGTLIAENIRLSTESQTGRTQAAEAAAKIKVLEARLATLEARKGTEPPAEQKPQEEAMPPPAGRKQLPKW